MTPSATSTVPREPADADRRRRARWGRRFGFGLLTAFLVLGMLELLGVRTATTAASAGGYELEVRYARITRPGLASPFDMTLTHPGGFDGPIRVRTEADYLAAFDENGLDPDAAAATADDRWVVWEFDPPRGDVLVISFDGRIEPGIHADSVTGTTQVLVDGAPVVSTSYRTWVLP